MTDNSGYHASPGVLAVLAERPVDELVQSVAALPLPLPAEGVGDRWNLRTSTVAWLRSRKSRHTRVAYFRDLADWLGWCEATGLDPRAARRGDVDMYAAGRGEDLAPTSLARRLSAISSWYRYLVSNDVAATNPLANVDRPTVDRDHSSTVALSAPEVTLFMRAARELTGRTAARDAALLGVLAELGVRVNEALSLDLEHLRHNRGHRTAVMTGKGGRTRELPIAAPLGRDLDRWLAARGDWPGPVFVTATGRRVGQPAAFRLVRRVAGLAGLPAADLLSPHGLRHTAITEALNAGGELRDVQDMAGHADPRTTRRYDRSRGSLDRSPAYLIAGLFAHDTGPEEAS